MPTAASSPGIAPASCPPGSEEAQVYFARLDAMESGFTVKSFAAAYPFTRDSGRQSYLHGLRLAGVPEA